MGGRQVSIEKEGGERQTEGDGVCEREREGEMEAEQEGRESQTEGEGE